MNPRYEQAWRVYRRRQRLVWGIMLLGMPATVALDALLPGLHVGLLIVCWWVILIAVNVWLHEFRCPSCGEPFHSTRWSKVFFPRHCQHCGLTRYREPGAELPPPSRP